ncbi:hypothetical protein MTR_4g037045 [Medicago truncatula]|uniref:R13L1/DRL21-like LRR repeat region domain-containing protein n=1 Tax=Medicago truncatula TaxID=3880 RepID=A0A072UI91_MEDTR|nr:hypothetical protein MTR_4g037045 [Medicago truncatula]
MYAFDECSIKSTRLKGLSTFKLKDIKYFHDIGSRLKKIASKIDQIAKSKNKFLSMRRCNTKKGARNAARCKRFLLVLDDVWNKSQEFEFRIDHKKWNTLKFVLSCGLKGDNLAKLHDLDLGGKLEIKGLQNIGSLFEAQEANLMDKKDLDELFLSWQHKDSSVKTPIISDDQVLEVLHLSKSQELENIFLQRIMLLKLDQNS